ncbi:MAG: hypothetical protein ACTS22_10370 [Phycisphaerales bacterium]
MASDQSDRVRRTMFVLCALGVLVVAAPFAVALQQRVVGGQALDANLRVDGSGFNTARTSNRVGGMQSSRYMPHYRQQNAAGLSSPAYRAGRNTSGAVNSRGGGGVTFSTGYGTFTTGGGGRADPLRNPQYSVLQTGTYVQRGSIPGGGRSYAMPRGMTTPRPAYSATRISTPRPKSSALSVPKYSVVHRR